MWDNVHAREPKGVFNQRNEMIWMPDYNKILEEKVDLRKKVDIHKIREKTGIGIITIKRWLEKKGINLTKGTKCTK